MMTDAELLHRYATENSQDAFAELVQRHLSLVYSTALRQLAGDAHLAQDVAQTVFTALTRKAHALSDRASLAGWLYLGTHHAAAQIVRSDRRRRAREEEAQAMHHTSDPSATTDWDRLRPVLDDALRELSDADREAVLLRFFEQQPFARIGAALRTTEDAARMRVDRALDKLRVLLDRRGINSTSAALALALGNQAMVAAPAGLAATIASTATAGGAAGVGAAAATATFMKAPLALISAVALVAIGLSVYQTKQFQRAKAAAAAAAHERDALRSQLRDTQQRATHAEQQAAQAAPQVSSARRETPGLMSTSPRSSLTASSSSRGRLVLSSSPTPPGETREETRRRIRQANIDGRDFFYQPLYRALAFSPMQREQFKNLIAAHEDRQRARLDGTMKAAMAQSPKPDRAAMQQLFDATVAQLTAEWHEDVRATFGDATVEAVKHHGETAPMRAVTKELAGALFETDTPLTTAQAEQLVNILAANSRNADGKIDLAAMDTAAIQAQAQAVLSPQQLAALRRAQEEVQRRWVTPPVANTGSLPSR